MTGYTPKLLHVLPACALTLLSINAIAAEPAKGWELPRTANGHPDLQGVWTSATLTRLERDREMGDRQVLTDEEVRKIEGTEESFVSSSAKPSDPTKKETAGECTNFQFGCGYNNFWIDRGSQVVRVNDQPRTSLIIDPSNGRIPGLLPARRSKGSFSGALAAR